MTLVDRVAYVLAKKFASVMLEAQDEAKRSDRFKMFIEDTMGPEAMSEGLEEFIDALKKDRDSNKPYEYAGMAKPVWYYYTIRAILNLKADIWLNKII